MNSVVEEDASTSGFGDVSSQNGHPLAFASKVSSETKGTLSAYERVHMVIDFAVKQWRSYLGGRPLIIKSDHLALKHLLEQKRSTQTSIVGLTSCGA